MLTIFLPLKETLVATFNKASALTSRKQVAYQGMNVQLHHKHLKFLAALHRFCFRKKSSKILTFQFFLHRKQPLVAPLSKTRPLISRRKSRSVAKGIQIFLINSKILIPFSAIYFVGMTARLSKKLTTGNSSIGLQQPRFTILKSRIFKIKIQECNQRNLLFSDRFTTPIPCSVK